MEKKEKKHGSRIAAFFIKDVKLKIASLFFAVIIWFIIINIDDPVQVRKFNVDVNIINSDAIESVNMVYEIEEGETATVRVRGRKSILDKLSSSDVSAVADLSELSSVNAVNIEPDISERYKEDVVLECNDVLKLKLEEMDTRQMQVQVETIGNVREGYALGECIAKPNMVEVTGGKSIIDKIDSLKVTVNIEDAFKSYTKKVPLVAYDSAGNKLTSSTLEYSNSKIRVRCEVYQTKSIPVVVNVTGEPEEGYTYVAAGCQPSEVQVYGDDENISNISNIEIPIDISGLNHKSEELEQNISVQEYLPEDVFVSSDDSILAIKIDIQKNIKSDFSVKMSNVSFTGVADGYKASLAENAYEYINVTVQGTKSALSEVTASTIKLVVDCTGKTEGNYSDSVSAESGQGVKVIKSGVVNYKIKRTAPTGDATTTVTETPVATTAPPATNETRTPVATVSPSPDNTESKETVEPKETETTEQTE